MRELKRRIAHQEPDDHVKTFIEKHPELHGLTDSYEWHSMENELNKLYREPINWRPQFSRPVQQVIIDGNGKVKEDADDDDLAEDDTALYVRIMSERVMATSRKIWAR